jgi:hypothetical protein
MAPALGQELGPLSLVVLGGTSTKTIYHGEQDFEPIPWFACVIPSEAYSGSNPSGISSTWSSSERLQIGQRAGCSAATLPRSEPRPIGMSLADPRRPPRDGARAEFCAIARDDQPAIRDRACVNGLASDKVLATGTEFGRLT